MKARLRNDIVEFIYGAICHASEDDQDTFDILMALVSFWLLCAEDTPERQVEDYRRFIATVGVTALGKRRALAAFGKQKTL